MEISSAKKSAQPFRLTFSELEDEHLINLVSKNRSLYDSTAHDYKDCTAKESKWVQIATALHRTPKQCKVRWKHIRDYYRKQKRTAAFTKGTQSRKRLYTECLRFLDETESEKNCINSCEPDVEFYVKTETVANEEIPSVSAATIEEEVYIVRAQENKNLQDVKIEAGLENAITEPCNKEEVDGINQFLDAGLEGDVDLFFKAMAATVKKFPAHTQANVKLKVFHLIYEEEMKQLSFS